MLVQVYGDSAMRKTAVYREENSSLQGGKQQFTSG